MTRLCAWCRAEICATARRDARYCSKRCRQAGHRFAREIHRETAAGAPLRLAIADPPYPGLSARYYADHPDYAGEVDHRALVSRLQGYDGWALATSARSLPLVLSLCAGVDVRVAAWIRGPRPGVTSTWPRSAWEPVVFCGGRRLPSREPGDDALVHTARPRLTDPARVVGAKPAAWCAWVFRLLGARPGDHLDDLFPGSGGVRRAWEVFTRDPAAVELDYVTATSPRDGSGVDE